MESDNGMGLRSELSVLSLFTGAGGGELATQHLLGFRTVCYVEIDPYCQAVIKARIRDGLLHDAPIWDDVRTFDGRHWRGKVDIVTGGFPCQDISVAGKGAGIEGDESGLWRDMCRIIGEVEPLGAFVENSPALTFRGIDRILGDLAEVGFDAQWGCLAAEDAIWAFGNPFAYHDRERIWLLANSQLRWVSQRRGIENSVATVRHGNRAEDLSESGCEQSQSCISANGNSEQRRARRSRRSVGTSKRIPLSERSSFSLPIDGWNCDWWKEGTTEPILLGMANGLAYRVDRIRAIGNGQVPIVAATAWRLLSGVPQ